jgi:hypothetical protein
VGKVEKKSEDERMNSGNGKFTPILRKTKENTRCQDEEKDSGIKGDDKTHL